MHPSQSDKLHPSFAEEDQALAETLNPVVMGPPAYASPDPETNSYALLGLGEHPAALKGDLADDYGGQLVEVLGVDGTSDVLTTMSPEEGLGLPEDRDEWTQENWKAAAGHYGLAKSGSKAQLQARVEEHETELEADENASAQDWKDEVEAADNLDELDAVEARYKAAGADYSTVDSAFTSKRAELTNG